jgi:GT2 family glycosyltransferase
MKPGVLIFVNWKTPHLVVQAVKTIRATASQPGLLRLVVVDNASGDDSLAVLSRELPEAELVSMPFNSGFAKAVNAGLARVRDEAFAFVLNTDIEFRNDAIGMLQAALEADAQAVLACPKLLRPDGSIQASAIPEPRIWWELINRSLPRHLMRLPSGPAAVPGIVGPCMAVHLERLQRIPRQANQVVDLAPWSGPAALPAAAPVPYLDERFFFFFEETDWCKRITDAGFHVLSVPEAEVMHLQGESANRRPVRARIQFYLSRYKYFRKHNGIAGLAVLFLGLWCRLTLDLALHGLLACLCFWKARHRDRVAVYAALWWWHARLCRPAWGFEPEGWSR